MMIDHRFLILTDAEGRLVSTEESLNAIHSERMGKDALEELDDIEFLLHLATKKIRALKERYR